MENKELTTREYIENLIVGDLAPDCFGGYAEITRIYGIGEDIRGRKYICYYTKFGETSSISRSLIEGQPLHYQI